MSMRAISDDLLHRLRQTGVRRHGTRYTLCSRPGTPVTKAPLHPQHRSHLNGSAISDEIIAARGYRTVARPTAGDPNSSKALLKRCGIPGWARRDDARYPGILIPLYRATGEHISWQYRPDRPPKDPDTGKIRKYAAQVGRTSVLDVHPANTDRVADPTQELWLTEGIKKGDALTTAGACVITLAGVFNWRGRLGTLGDWEDIPLKGRTVIICFDADARTNTNVARAMVRLGKWLKSKGAKIVLYLITPDQVNGVAVKGADDYLAAGGTLQTLRAEATTNPPAKEKMLAAFSDAMLAETVADAILDGRYCWSAGLGWLKWDGKRWVRCPDAAVIESVRGYAIEQFRRAASEAEIEGWLSVLGRSRLTSITTLAKGITLVSSDDLDAHPDLLNAANGVINLTSGELIAHSPQLLLTKLAPVNYVPGAKHADWDAALAAIPSEVRDWYQIRAGQAISGYMTPDDLMVVQVGGGENGKTTLTSGITGALGDYYTLISHRALLGDPSQHPTELMSFRGARFALLEETPEERRLSVVRLKSVIGTPQIKARLMRQDDVTFDATHSLFLSTNYLPVVEETDHGTWRRLACLRFPYTFRKPGDPLTSPHDRTGDPGLRERLALGDDGQHEAVLAWLVAGATAWYEADKVMPPLPERVQADTRAWRAESDLIVAYLDERIIFDTNAHIMSAELLDDFNEWITRRGHRTWSDRTFAARFGGHGETATHRVEKKNIRARDGLSRIPLHQWDTQKPVPTRYHAWLGVRFRTDADDRADDEPTQSVDQHQCEGGTGGTGTSVPRTIPIGRSFGDTRSTRSTPSDACPRCRWPIDSRGHAERCGGDAA